MKIVHSAISSLLLACGEATQKTLDEPTKCWHHNVFEDISSRDGSVICRDCDETVILCRHQYPVLYVSILSEEAAKHTCFNCGAPRSEQPYGACDHRYPEGVSSRLALCLKCGISKPESVHVG